MRASKVAVLVVIWATALALIAFFARFVFPEAAETVDTLLQRLKGAPLTGAQVLIGIWDTALLFTVLAASLFVAGGQFVSALRDKERSRIKDFLEFFGVSAVGTVIFSLSSTLIVGRLF